MSDKTTSSGDLVAWMRSDDACPVVHRRNGDPYCADRLAEIASTDTPNRKERAMLAIESEAMRFWRECVRGNRTGRTTCANDPPYRVVMGARSIAAWFNDGSALEWDRRTGEMLSFVPVSI